MLCTPVPQWRGVAWRAPERAQCHDIVYIAGVVFAGEHGSHAADVGPVLGWPGGGARSMGHEWLITVGTPESLTLRR